MEAIEEAAANGALVLAVAGIEAVLLLSIDSSLFVYWIAGWEVLKGVV